MKGRQMTPQVAFAVHGWWTAQKTEQAILARIEHEQLLLSVVQNDMSAFQSQIHSLVQEGPSRLIEVEPGVFIMLAWQPRDDYHTIELATVVPLGDHEDPTYVVPT
jgi:hypothetical protein